MKCRTLIQSLVFSPHIWLSWITCNLPWEPTILSRVLQDTSREYGKAKYLGKSGFRRWCSHRDRRSRGTPWYCAFLDFWRCWLATFRYRTHLVRSSWLLMAATPRHFHDWSVPQFSGKLLFVRNCSCPHVKCKRLVGVCVSCPFLYPGFHQFRWLRCLQVAANWLCWEPDKTRSKQNHNRRGWSTPGHHPFLLC